jgi:glycosyltransferase involved in cell wall biosynthesis
VFWKPGVNTGIQRTVRNISASLPYFPQRAECVSIVLANDRVYGIENLSQAMSRKSFCFRFDARLHQLNGLIHPDGRLSWKMPAAMISRIVRVPLTLALRALAKAGCDPLAQSGFPLVPRPGDHLVLLDSNWHKGYFGQIEKLKAKNLKITAVIYDVLPLTRPEFFANRLHAIYDNWFSWVIQHADTFACISRSVCDEVRLEVSKRLGLAEAAKRNIFHFYLGSELDLQTPCKPLSAEVSRVFSTEESLFLAVGTIEPRKNHAYLLDTFDLLWESGANSKLCLVGSAGWKCDEIVRRIQRHPNLGSKLFWLDKLDDDGLDYAYRHADALLISSHAEGFGLPIVEALQRGLPVMASDIAVFREIGGDFVAYFDLANPQSLVDLVQAYERTRTIPCFRSPQEWRWIDWKDSAKQLVDGVISSAA